VCTCVGLFGMCNARNHVLTEVMHMHIHNCPTRAPEAVEIASTLLTHPSYPCARKHAHAHSATSLLRPSSFLLQIWALDLPMPVLLQLASSSTSHPARQ
jgi:hypothetical protein